MKTSRSAVSATSLTRMSATSLTRMDVLLCILPVALFISIISLV